MSNVNKDDNNNNVDILKFLRQRRQKQKQVIVIINSGQTDQMKEKELNTMNGDDVNIIQFYNGKKYESLSNLHSNFIVTGIPLHIYH